MWTRYNLQELVEAILEEQPELDIEQARQKALAIRRELNRLDKSWSRSQARFRRYNIPASHGLENSFAARRIFLGYNPIFNRLPRTRAVTDPS